MKAIILLMSTICLMSCCPETVTRETRESKDSASVTSKPQRVETPAQRDTLYIKDTVRVIDSVKVPIIEYLESKDKKRSVTIDRTGIVPIAIFNQAKDSIDVMVKEATYWKWLSETKETKVIENYSFADNVLKIGLVIFVILLMVYLIRGK